MMKHKIRSRKFGSSFVLVLGILLVGTIVMASFLKRSMSNLNTQSLNTGQKAFQQVVLGTVEQIQAAVVRCANSQIAAASHLPAGSPVPPIQLMSSTEIQAGACNHYWPAEVAPVITSVVLCRGQGASAVGSGTSSCLASSEPAYVPIIYEIRYSAVSPDGSLVTMTRKFALDYPNANRYALLVTNSTKPRIVVGAGLYDGMTGFYGASTNTNFQVALQPQAGSTLQFKDLFSTNISPAQTDGVYNNLIMPSSGSYGEVKFDMGILVSANQPMARSFESSFDQLAATSVMVNPPVPIIQTGFRPAQIAPIRLPSDVTGEASGDPTGNPIIIGGTTGESTGDITSDGQAPRGTEGGGTGLSDVAYSDRTYSWSKPPVTDTGGYEYPIDPQSVTYSTTLNFFPQNGVCMLNYTITASTPMNGTFTYPYSIPIPFGSTRSYYFRSGNITIVGKAPGEPSQPCPHNTNIAFLSTDGFEFQSSVVFPSGPENERGSFSFFSRNAGIKTATPNTAIDPALANGKTNLGQVTSDDLSAIGDNVLVQIDASLLAPKASVSPASELITGSCESSINRGAISLRGSVIAADSSDNRTRCQNGNYIGFKKYNLAFNPQVLGDSNLAFRLPGTALVGRTLDQATGSQNADTAVRFSTVTAPLNFGNTCLTCRAKQNALNGQSSNGSQGNSGSGIGGSQQQFNPPL